MKTGEPTKLQKQIIDIVAMAENPWGMGRNINTSGRCISYWASGQIIPRDIATIEDVLSAYGYELQIVRKTEPTVDKDINVRSKDEPQTEQPYIDIETGILHWCGWEYRRIYEDEPQTDDLQDWKDRMWAEAVIEPQTERSEK